MVRRLFEANEVEGALIKMGKECPEIEWQDPPCRVAPMVAYFRDTAKNENVRFLGYFDKTGELRGYIVGWIQDDPQTGEKVGHEYLWCVSPDWRHTRAPLALLKAFEIECKEAGCGYVQFCYAMEIYPDKLAQLYDKLGYRPVFTYVRKKF